MMSPSMQASVMKMCGAPLRACIRGAASGQQPSLCTRSIIHAHCYGQVTLRVLRNDLRDAAELATKILFLSTQNKAKFSTDAHKKTTTRVVQEYTLLSVISPP